MADLLSESFVAALQALGNQPRDFLKRARVEAGDRDENLQIDWHVYRELLRDASPNDAIRHGLHAALARWDNAPVDQEWTAGTLSNTTERRQLTYDALGFDAETATMVGDLFGVTSSGVTVISKEPTAWYTEERKAENFYWSAYKGVLDASPNWDGEAVQKLDEASTKVVERLSDPWREDAKSTKGLVVGYVQSGKTANFTGVIAKAIDAGYRLIIVFTGTVDILRQQTQRRLDMELAGVENIMGGTNLEDPETWADTGYLNDPKWNKFLRHGFLPADAGYPNINRLTSYDWDYKRLQNGISAIEFQRESADRSLPLNHPTNLRKISARVAVIKKNPTILAKLAGDLTRISTQLGQVPTLIIDDESDLASVNTKKPAKTPRKPGEDIDRTSTNKTISDLVNQLPRAQYVGYTATPFANVFIDPGDPRDLFPNDFLVSLERPPAYMGVSDFHDLDESQTISDETRTVANSNELAHVRNVYGERDTATETAELTRAMDAFVLTGAIKLYREHQGDVPTEFFEHHTMLVHESTTQIDHRLMAEKIQTIWDGAEYRTPVGLARIRELWDTDFSGICAARSGQYSVPPTFDVLIDLIGESVNRITKYGPCVAIINGDKDYEQPALAFSKESVWRIIVGGQKLSRGFTVEGLTITFFRRVAMSADSLAQMGRWFGFRTGYRDLVRLWIARSIPKGRRTIDLYEAFEAVMLDEEAFRNELRKYAEMQDGLPKIVPAEIPPLVRQHLPWLSPTSAGKMFNARIVTRRTSGEPLEPMTYPDVKAEIAANYDMMLPLMESAGVIRPFQIANNDGQVSGSFDAHVGVVSGQTFVSAFESLHFQEKSAFNPDFRFLRELIDQNEIDDWVVLMPSGKGKGYTGLLPGLDGPRTIFKRARNRGRDQTVFHHISEERHRAPAMRIAGALRTSYGDSVVEEYVRPKRGAILIYPVVDFELSATQLSATMKKGEVVIGFRYISPAGAKTSSPNYVEFEPVDSSTDAATIWIPADEADD